MKLFNKRSSFLYRLYLFWSPLKCWVHSHQRLISSPKFVIFSLSLSSHLLSISLILSSDSPNTDFTSCIRNWRLWQASWCEHLSSGISCEFLQKYYIVENLWNVEFFFRSFKELFGYATLLCKTCTYCIYHKTKTAVVLFCAL